MSAQLSMPVGMRTGLLTVSEIGYTTAAPSRPRRARRVEGENKIRWRAP